MGTGQGVRLREFMWAIQDLGLKVRWQHDE